MTHKQYKEDNKKRNVMLLLISYIKRHLKISTEEHLTTQLTYNSLAYIPEDIVTPVIESRELYTKPKYVVHIL